MTKLIIPHIEVPSELSARDAAKRLAGNAQAQKIDKVNWNDFPYAPEVSFSMAHTGDEIWLEYRVREKYIRAVETRTNGDVYKDSTVEFFISLDGKTYYNFEFSCIGTIHLGHGAGRENRQYIDPAVAGLIKIESSLGSEPFEERAGDFRWNMFICIPKECFVFDELKSFSGCKATGNFYKCGDATSIPHFITWNPIGTQDPDYHRPEYFGELEFE